jgi:cation diffusion facilitator family transporter
MHEGSRRAIFAAFLANLGIAVAKFVAYVFTGAASMLAEAIHSVADTGNQGLLFLGGARSRRPADPTRPFGYATARYFWAFVVALVLFSLGGIFAIFEGIEKLLHPHEVEDLHWAIGVLLLAIVLESLSFRTAVREGRKERRPGQSWWRFIRTTKAPEIPVVLLEDLGALCGLVLALCGLALAEITGEPRFDAAGSLAIGTLLVVIAIVLAIEMSSLLLGEAASPEDVASIEGAILSHPHVRRVIHLRTEHLGPEDVLVAAKLEFDRALSVDELTRAIDDVEARIRVAVPIARLVFVEPDVYVPARSRAVGGSGAE